MNIRVSSGYEAGPFVKVEIGSDGELVMPSVDARRIALAMLDAAAGADNEEFIVKNHPELVLEYRHHISSRIPPV